MRGSALPAGFFDREVETVARELLGMVVRSELGRAAVTGRIVEVEAYRGAEDPASHAYGFRRNSRNTAIYGPPGSWYVYLSYGMHWCANLVAGPPGAGAAVLLRALEPLDGVEVMRRRRGGVGPRQCCAGPGRLCQALGITRRRLDGRRMARSPVRIVYGEAPGDIEVTPRIGLTKAADWPLRFVVRGTPWSSRSPIKVEGRA
jgi:DNA-3-methyladenine glycosylase